jgi:predicted amidohydrolase
MVQFRAACIQMTAGDDVPANIAHATALIRTAQSQGASFIATPEMTNLMENRSAELREKSTIEAQSDGVKRFSALAAELQIWLLIGSQAIKVDDDDRLANRSLLFDPSGKIVGRYDKIHMFDVDLPSGETYRESRNYRPGDQACLVDTALGKIGLSICYDLRFPALYRAYGQAGAQILTVPSAFTKVTGEAHWHVLLRARAIENACFVIAPAQCGTHPRGRQTYGHSLIISPWGEVLADGGIQPGIVFADIDTDLCAQARARIPSLSHDRAFATDGFSADV